MRNFLISCMMILLAHCIGGMATADTDTIKAFVSILPQAYFVERVGGAHVAVEVLVGPGQSPATYEPTPKQLARLGRSQIYYRIGTPFEQGFIRKLSNTYKNLKVVDTRNGVPMRYFRGTKGHGVPDPHIWLDPMRVAIQAGVICESLSLLAPERRSYFEENLKSFKKDLREADKRISEKLAPFRGSRFYVFHPAFGYFADAYGLEQVAIETEGKTPSPRQLTRLINRAREEGAKVVFVQPQYSRRDAEAISKAIGCAVVPMDPLSNNYLKNLEQIADAIRLAFEKN